MGDHLSHAQPDDALKQRAIICRCDKILGGAQNLSRLAQQLSPFRRQANSSGIPFHQRDAQTAFQRGDPG